MLAEAWGWTVAAIDPVPWLDVIRYYDNAVKCKGRRLIDQFILVRSTGRQLDEFIDRINSLAGFKESSRQISDEDQLETWAMFMGNSPKAQEARDTAAYIRTMKRRGLKP